jgi:hypothetical protein
MITVLQKDCGVRYNLAKIPEDVPFDASDTFIHGIIQGDGGTCASLPVLYVAIGRRLGYPLKLVSAHMHVFARWDEPGERFNIEATGPGLSCHTDYHYRTGRYRASDAIVRACGFLQSKTPNEELAMFLASRSVLLLDICRWDEARECLAWSSLLAPHVVSYKNFPPVPSHIKRN